MSIKGISEVRRLPRLGKIRLGIKETSQKSGNLYPKAVDYFVCNADQSTPEAAAKGFHRVYGDKPRALDIMFPVEDRDQFFAQFYRRYGSGSGLLCKGDGQSAMEIDKETGEIKEIECNPVDCEWANKKHCRPVGTLQFLLPKVNGLGAWQIDTSSYHSIVNLNSAIDFVRALTGSRIAMIPLKLIIRSKEVQVEGKKKTIYVLDLANEEIRLQDILMASKQSVAQLLLPGINFEEAPDDLFPPALLEQGKQIVPEQNSIKKEPAKQELIETKIDPIDQSLHEAWEALKTPTAKRNAILKKPGLDKQALLKQLEAEVAKRQVNQTPSKMQQKDKTNKSTQAGTTDLISDAQVKRMYAIGGGNEELVKEILGNHDYKSAKDVRQSEYKAICQEIESYDSEPGTSAEDILDDFLSEDTINDDEDIKLPWERQEAAE